MRRHPIGTIAAAAAILALTLTGCTAAEPEVTPAPAAETTEPVAVVTPTPTPTPTAEPTAGTRAAPLALGEARVIEEESAWVVSITAADHNAYGQLKAMDPYTEEPPAGSQYVLGTVSVSIVEEAMRAQGGDLENTGVDVVSSLNIEYVGGNGQAYTEWSADTYCSSNNSWSNLGGLYSYDATASGDVCLVVPTEAIPGGLWRISNSRGAAVWVKGAE